MSLYNFDFWPTSGDFKRRHGQLLFEYALSFWYLFSSKASGGTGCHMELVSVFCYMQQL